MNIDEIKSDLEALRRKIEQYENEMNTPLADYLAEQVMGWQKGMFCNEWCWVSWEGVAVISHHSVAEWQPEKRAYQAEEVRQAMLKQAFRYFVLYINGQYEVTFLRAFDQIKPCASTKPTEAEAICHAAALAMKEWRRLHKGGTP